jgi:predicted nuclease of predicted toxin-antitoxin system
MLLVADEGVDRGIVERFRLDGHEVLYVADMAPGIPDTAVLQETGQQDGVLVTADKDFGELVFRQGRAASGVVLLRLAGLSARTKADVCSEAFRTYAAEIRGAFTVISPGAVRIRARHRQWTSR